MEFLVGSRDDLSRLQKHLKDLETRYSVTVYEKGGPLEKEVRLVLIGEDEDALLKAKNYVESLIQTSSPPVSSSSGPDKLDLFDNILLLEDKSSPQQGTGLSQAGRRHDSVSKSSSSSSWDHSLSQQGQHTGVYRSVSDTSATDSLDKRKKLESEDSSYDSDYELSGISKSHEDVSRTFSDTLASEFNEYVSIDPKEEEEGSLDDFLLSSDPEYHGKVEFALRLGYPEGLLIKALRKLGPTAGQDKILAELIRLQNSKPPYFPNAVVVDLEKPVQQQHQEETMTHSKGLLPSGDESDSFLPIVIDGSNVAMSHGNKEIFSCRGIQLCVNWFQEKGLKNITVFVPRWRKESSKPESPISDQHILTELEKDRILAYTPSRQVGGRRVVCHDDRYILNLAAETGAVVVSNDNYRELLAEKPEYKEVITKRILMYSFVNDRFMPPDDPMGKNGPSLNSFLRGLTKNLDANHSTPCPYGKKCTYGNKCKYFHAERGNQPQKSITDKLKEHSSARINEVRARVHSRDSSPGDPLTRTVSVNIPPRIQEKQRLCRTQSNIPSRAFDRSHLKPSYQQRLLPSKVHGSKSFESLPLDSRWSNTLNVPPYADLSVPPPAPRTPWQQNTPPSPPRRHSTTSSPSSYKMMDSTNAHLKLSRQLSLHPCFDGRLQRFLIPPPPPHQSVSRNASAPECYINGSTPFSYVSPADNSHPHLHKTVSDSVPIDTDWSNGLPEQQRINYGPIGSSRKNSGYPLMASSRQKLFIHLKAIFPETQVIAAMSALPDETDGQKICEHIISMSSHKL